jgi:hypothetical protein
MRLLITLMFTTLLGASVYAQGARVLPPLRLSNGEPMVAVYFFGHWWQPWMSDDEAIRRDLRRLRAMGFNTLLLDHQFSQSLDGDWKWLDREHRLAKECGFVIVPWLEAHGGNDISIGDRRQQAAKRLGIPADIPLTVKQDGSQGGALITSPAFKDYLTAYVTRYVERYRKDGALLHVMKNGKPRPVVTLGCELDITLYDAQTNREFIRWLKRRYRDDLSRLNRAWGAQFGAFEEIDPRDTRLFDYSDPQKHLPNAVKDHALFRAELGNAVFAEITKRLKRRFPDLLILAEMPYPFDCPHPHGPAYQWSCAALPEAFRFADILMLRWIQGRPTQPERDAIARFRKMSRADVVICYRVSDMLSGEHGSDTAAIANGIGFYSWNEMVDAHAVENPPSVGTDAFRLDRAASEKIVRGMDAAVQAYLAAVGRR